MIDWTLVVVLGSVMIFGAVTGVAVDSAIRLRKFKRSLDQKQKQEHEDRKRLEIRVHPHVKLVKGPSHALGQQPLARRIAAQLRSDLPKPPTQGPKGGAGNSGAA